MGPGEIVLVLMVHLTENVASPEVVKQLHDILIWRDGVMRDIQAKISMIPGLESLMENMSNGINTCECVAILNLGLADLAAIDRHLYTACGTLAACDSSSDFRLTDCSHTLPRC